jgi:hypothetical protein
MSERKHNLPNHQVPLDDLPDQLMRGAVLLLRAVRRSPKAVRQGSQLAACARALASGGHVRVIDFGRLHLVRNWRQR